MPGLVTPALEVGHVAATWGCDRRPGRSEGGDDAYKDSRGPLTTGAWWQVAGYIRFPTDPADPTDPGPTG